MNRVWLVVVVLAGACHHVDRGDPVPVVAHAAPASDAGIADASAARPGHPLHATIAADVAFPAAERAYAVATARAKDAKTTADACAALPDLERALQDFVWVMPPTGTERAFGEQVGGLVNYVDTVIHQYCVDPGADSDLIRQDLASSHDDLVRLEQLVGR